MSTIVFIQFTIFILATIGFLVMGFNMLRSMDSDFEAMEYDELMGIIDSTIMQQFKFKYELDYKLKDIRVLNDFEKELDELSKSVLLSFGSNFYRHVDYYHDRDYVYRYVVKKTEIMLLEFADRIKPKTM